MIPAMRNLLRPRWIQVGALAVLIAAAAAVWAVRSTEPSAALEGEPFHEVVDSFANDLAARHDLEELCAAESSAAIDGEHKAHGLRSAAHLPDDAIAQTARFETPIERYDMRKLTDTSVILATRNPVRQTPEEGVADVDILGRVIELSLLTGGEAGGDRWYATETAALYACAAPR